MTISCVRRVGEPPGWIPVLLSIKDQSNAITNAIIYLDIARAEVIKQANRPKLYFKLHLLITWGSGYCKIIYICYRKCFGVQRILISCAVVTGLLIFFFVRGQRLPLIDAPPH